jgi:hypothetical protein
VVGTYQAAFDKPSDKRDDPVLAQYALLIVVLSALSRLPVPLPG